MEATAREVSERYVRREECDRLLEEKEQAIAGLQSENYQLRVAGEQCQRYLKRYEMKHELLNSKVHHLTKTLAEKEAIIKYLEGKTAPNPPPPTFDDSLH
jgi:chromosome segregation ATPase